MRRIAVVLALTLGAGSALAADNVNVTAGSGTVAATKDIGGGVQAPKVVIIDPNGNLMSTSQGIQVFVPNGVTQSGTWTVQPGNTANTTPWLATVNQGGNSAAVAAAGSAYGNALAVAGGITPGYGTLGGQPASAASGPLSDPILAGSVTPGTNAGTPWRNLIPGGLAIPSMTSAGYLVMAPGAGISFRHLLRQGGAAAAYAVSVTGANGAHTLQSLQVTVPNAQGFVGLKLYDIATTPTCTTATGLVHFFAVPNSVTGGGTWSLPSPVDFGTGIGFCVISAQGAGVASWIESTGTGFTLTSDANGITINGVWR